ncbi:Protein-lysine N-methyltransferase rrg1 [Lithohypha guttulata]|uniref:Protein-lysine N-methyltransferase rrg1 n=1 Tax=Lithohypha guttulata TaxID=1690604 RepID=A0AAN7TEM7_9EURO|nr:Protein-lysine N-methyltransferase rrg1 [Lithohypha guttulata]KAK5100393.1 Protein-lysine N-methyltransferase rrg1 [Lithohypha guttulata]
MTYPVKFYTLYTKPSAESLLSVLQSLRRGHSNFSSLPLSSSTDQSTDTIWIDPAGVAGYLTSIIASSLQWLTDDDRELVWDQASLRISERSGRSAAPAINRAFMINNNLTIHLHEPSLTEDNLGLKTWTSSLLLSRQLMTLVKHVPSGTPRMLELGSGTGLVGLAAASIWQGLLSEVLLTDLPEIVPNLQHNIDHNASLFPEQRYDGDSSVKVHCRALNWADATDTPSEQYENFHLIVAADPIYSSDHPRLLTDTVHRWLAPSSSSRFIVELPLRSRYQRERADLRQKLEVFMEVIEEGEEVGYDDWEGADGQPIEVRCWWSVWKLRDVAEQSKPITSST